MLFDAHTHLNYEEFSEEERLDRAREIEESDVEFIIDVGDSVESSEQAVKDAADYSWCYAAVGIHPDKALTYSDDDIDRIKELASAPKVQAIGEIGLDFHYGKDSRAEQIELFRKQIRIADNSTYNTSILKKRLAFSDVIRTASSNPMSFNSAILLTTCSIYGVLLGLPLFGSGARKGASVSLIIN